MERRRLLRSVADLMVLMMCRMRGRLGWCRRRDSGARTGYAEAIGRTCPRGNEKTGEQDGDKPAHLHQIYHNLYSEMM